MIRLSLLWMFVGFLAVYAWRDWFKALCGLILLMAVIQHPDFPKSIMGIQGMNPWNILLFFVGLAWLASRRREGLKWDVPREVNWLLFFYFFVIVIAFVRAAVHIDEIIAFYRLRGLESTSYASLFSEQIINCFKWVVPGLMLFDGCRTEKRFRIAVFVVLAVYVLLAVQVIRWMPISGLTGGEALTERSLKILVNEVGYHRVNMSMLLAGASWAIFSARDLVDSRKLKLAIMVLVFMVLFAQALTGGRMGYATWFMIAIMFGVLKWRKILVIAPIAAALVIALVPAVKDRLTQGFDQSSMATNSRIEAHQFREGDQADLYTVTSGRTFAWGFVVPEIAKAPLVGHGRQGMVTTGVAPFLLLEYGESFPHPHNAYLQWLLDNGLLGTIPVFFFFLLVFRRSLSLFREPSCRDCVVIGGVTLSLVAALLIAGMGSQSFYPREGAVGMWCAIGLMLRVYVQHARRASSHEPLWRSAGRVQQ